MSVMITNKSALRMILASALILMMPLAAMQFTDEVNWSAFDFVIAATLLIGSGLMFDLIARRSRNLAYQVGVGVAVVTGLIPVWVNLAVGLIGNEEHPANLMYFVVLLAGFIGAIVARFRPRGMSRVLFSVAIAQAMVPVIALMIWQPPLTVGVLKVFVMNTVFAMLFAGSALLFQRASRDAMEVRPSA